MADSWQLCARFVIRALSQQRVSPTWGRIVSDPRLPHAALLQISNLSSESAVSQPTRGRIMADSWLTHGSFAPDARFEHESASRQPTWGRILAGARLAHASVAPNSGFASRARMVPKKNGAQSAMALAAAWARAALGPRLVRTQLRIHDLSAESAASQPQFAPKRC